MKIEVKDRQIREFHMNKYTRTPKEGFWITSGRVRDVPRIEFHQRGEERPRLLCQDCVAALSGMAAIRHLVEHMHKVIYPCPKRYTIAYTVWIPDDAVQYLPHASFGTAIDAIKAAEADVPPVGYGIMEIDCYAYDTIRGIRLY